MLVGREKTIGNKSKCMQTVRNSNANNYARCQRHTLEHSSKWIHNTIENVYSNDIFLKFEHFAGFIEWNPSKISAKFNLLDTSLHACYLFLYNTNRIDHANRYRSMTGLKRTELQQIKATACNHQIHLQCPMTK